MEQADRQRNCNRTLCNLNAQYAKKNEKIKVIVIEHYVI